jgi:hypothetical protein
VNARRHDATYLGGRAVADRFAKHDDRASLAGLSEII